MDVPWVTQGERIYFIIYKCSATETLGNYAAERREQMMSLPGVVIWARLGTVPIIWLITLRNNVSPQYLAPPASTDTAFIDKDNQAQNKIWSFDKTNGARIHAVGLIQHPLCDLFPLTLCV